MPTAAPGCAMPAAVAASGRRGSGVALPRSFRVLSLFGASRWPPTGPPLLREASTPMRAEEKSRALLRPRQAVHACYGVAGLQAVQRLWQTSLVRFPMIVISDREAIPEWMPFISSVKVLKDKPDLSRWTLKYDVFGRDVEFSWLARNLQPIRNQKIHWRSLEGLPNRGAVRFYPKGPSSCRIELTVSYEVPQILIPVASALKPFLERLLLRGLEGFVTVAKSYQSRLS